jgi:small-conductance mechanosensitive channel
LPSLLFLIVWVFIIGGMLKLNRLFWKWVDAGAIVLPGFYKEWAYPTAKILAFLLIAFGLVVAFPYLPGGNSDAFKGVSIFIGVLISLGSGSAMGNIVSGVILTYTRAFRVGDRIRVGEHTGDVIERTLLVTRLRTIKNEDVIIPNSTVVSTSVVNYSEVKDSGQLILHTTVTIGYDAPWQKVHELLIEAARRTEGILPAPVPFVLQTALNDYNVSYQINAYTDAPARMAVIYSDLHRNIQDTFNEGGVEIMSPGYQAIRDGNQTTIPESYLSPEYRKPGFRIESS